LITKPFHIRFEDSPSGRKGYIHGLIVEGPEVEVLAFQAWLHEVCKKGFREVSRIKSKGYYRKDGSEVYPPRQSIKYNFKDRGKLALVKLVWHPV
jgi:hypothetical protein